VGSGEGQALFCNLGPIRVREVLHRGDNQPLPTDVTVQGLAVPMAGTYDIFNARVSSNGDIALVVDDKTRALKMSYVPAIGTARPCTVTSVGNGWLSPRCSTSLTRIGPRLQKSACPSPLPTSP